jgi:hypothetical protein
MDLFKRRFLSRLIEYHQWFLALFELCLLHPVSITIASFERTEPQSEDDLTRLYSFVSRLDDVNVRLLERITKYEKRCVCAIAGGVDSALSVAVCVGVRAITIFDSLQIVCAIFL